MSVYKTWFIEQLAGRDETTSEMKLSNMWASAAWHESQKMQKIISKVILTQKLMIYIITLKTILYLKLNVK